MTGPKLNEATFVAGERSGVKSSAKYVRSSAYKARAVLDLIRGLPVRNADEVLQFTDREVSGTIRKVLASAVANAQHNDELDPETLYVKACFADEGPTLKRFRPRAKGRASRIRKRTAHITIVLGVLDDARLEVVQAREAKRTAAGRRRGAAGGNVASRRARVERSRQRAAALKKGDEGYEEQQAALAAEAEASEAVETVDAVETEAADGAQQFAGAVHAPDADSAPEGFEIKGNAQSMLYHVPGSRYYGQTKAEYWFDSVESAEAAGFSAPGGTKSDDAESEEDDK